MVVTKWDRTPTVKYQLFMHNLNNVASVWLVFIKKKFMPTCHNITISLDRLMLLYCIMMKILVNVGDIIYEHLVTRVKHPHGAKPFMHLIE